MSENSSKAWDHFSPQEIVRRTRCLADETRDAVVWRDCCDLILERLGDAAALVPDQSGVGGDVKQPELVELLERWNEEDRGAPTSSDGLLPSVEPFRLAGFAAAIPSRIPADPDSVRALAPELWADLDKEIAEGINQWMEDDGYEGLDSPSDISQGIADCCVAAVLTRYRSLVPAALGTEAEGQDTASGLVHEGPASVEATPKSPSPHPDDQTAGMTVEETQS